MQIGPLKIKLQLLCGESFAFGPGKADLLDAIKREGSISAAGRALGMSYRRAWLLTDEMNRCFQNKLVETAAGGNSGGGARLTESGRTLLAAYRNLEAEAASLSDSEECRTLTSALRERPVPIISH